MAQVFCSVHALAIIPSENNWALPLLNTLSPPSPDFTSTTIVTSKNLNGTDH